MKNRIKNSVLSVTNELQTINFNQLSISSYNKEYIRHMKYAFSYFLKIYGKCILKGLETINRPLSELILIDYGGGSGFLSILAKHIGFNQVIYIDININSVNTIKTLKQEIGIGPDIILHGNSDYLKTWCKHQNCKPHLLIATDLIEHVYQLEPFFSDLIAINAQMLMLFTTASTPFNPYIKRRLHRYMIDSEIGTNNKLSYYNQRLEYIQKNFPHFSKQEAENIAYKTRGLIFSDIHKAIILNTYPSLKDPYNTCDPTNGNWTERILPINDYRSIVQPHGLTIKVEKGFYNNYRKNMIISLLIKCINIFIHISGKLGFLIAPFIFLTFQKK